ncbi:hypothetical protein G3O08_04585 [Cryomorpha ignava]|uniref:Type I-B CRISPR-associated protein Cas8b/Csh1 n=1 Tax=Cryomorpha ignava TaxID=101383 RepID=A0A7K3WMA3_9FLAO|nr:TM1802 family CRISPR-associated protein [Cryomorpha ignava]NEN22776.1 hypothetical protein [Cryomorpha ignava]
MLDTLLKIGEWQSEGKSEWDRFLEYPKVETKDKYGNSITNYTLPIIFDLDNQEVIIKPQNLKEFEAKDVREAKGIKMKGSNSKAICSSGLSKRLGRIYQAFFGKEGEETSRGELLEAVEKNNPELLTENLRQILSKIFELKNRFLELTTESSKNIIDIRAIQETFEFGKNENIVFLAFHIKSKEFGFEKVIPFAHVPDYEAFLQEAYFGSDIDAGKKGTKKKLCYASGTNTEDVEELNLSTRYSLNKMFVTETKNYASLFDKRKFNLNYQVSAENQEKLDYASDYLLNKGYKIRIAGLDHVIIPQFQQNSTVDIEMALKGIYRKSDILFSLHKLLALSESVSDESDDAVFWINFIAFESDGNFFKSTEIIKDVSNFHFNKILEAFAEVDWHYRDLDAMDWDSIMMEYDYDSKDRVRRNFNFNSIFKIIPLRKEKEKKNKALGLFKTILENRKVNIEILYDYFCELILCHWYQRYGSYTNVSHYTPKNFYFGVRDSVFKYHAFIQFLKKLNLINMDESNEHSGESTGNKYDDAEQSFFKEMDMLNHKDQQAMFYLGRMLNKVEYIQKDKNKTVIEKVNFNGMDKDDIVRLRIGLVEKAKQYNQVSKVIFIDQKFGVTFDTNSWNMNPKEAVFHLLTGYSFGVGQKDAETLTQIETEESH